MAHSRTRACELAGRKTGRKKSLELITRIHRSAGGTGGIGKTRAVQAIAQKTPINNIVKKAWVAHSSRPFTFRDDYRRLSLHARSSRPKSRRAKRNQASRTGNQSQRCANK